jgi:hypothetical protein
MIYQVRHYFLVPLKSTEHANGSLRGKRQIINKSRLRQTIAFNKQSYALSESKRKRRGGLHCLSAEQRPKKRRRVRKQKSRQKGYNSKLNVKLKRHNIAERLKIERQSAHERNGPEKKVP